MDAKPTSLMEYFSGEKQNLVPLFQRQYTWKKKDWQKLWDDLIECHEAESEGMRHFLGAVVSVPVRSVPVGVAKHLIIDGQQRLTSVSLLLVAIRDRAAAMKGERLVGRLNDLLINQYHDGNDHFKLLPTETDRDAFRKIIEGADGEASGQIYAGYKFFDNALRSHLMENEPAAREDFDGGVEQLSSLYDSMRRAFHVVAIALGEHDDPYVIFESLNHDGQPLSQADLIRNTVLMRFPHSKEDGGIQREVYQELWLPLQTDIKTAKTDGTEFQRDQVFSEFFRHYATVDGAEVRKSGIYSAVKRQLDTLSGPDEAKSEISRMKLMANWYRSFINPSLESDDAKRSALETMQALDTTIAFPLLLLLHELAHQKTLSQDDLRQSFFWVESFLVRRIVCDVPTNVLRRLFLGWVRNLDRSQPMASLREMMLDGARGSRWPDDKEFLQHLVVSDQYQRRSTLPILKRLEASFEHKESADLQKCTIEHVMPQTITSAWVLTLGEDHEEKHASHLHRLGNLTLTAYNAELGNLSFKDKKARYLESNVQLNRSIANSVTWGTSEIDKRGLVLASEICKLYPRA